MFSDFLDGRFVEANGSYAENPIHVCVCLRMHHHCPVVGVMRTEPLFFVRF